MKKLLVVFGVMAVMLTGCTGEPKTDLALIQAKNSCQSKFNTWKNKHPESAPYVIKSAYFNSSMNSCLVEIAIARDFDRVIDIYGSDTALIEIVYIKGESPTIIFLKNGKNIETSPTVDQNYFKEVNQMFEVNQ